MPSATDFLPSNMTLFMNFESTMSPNFGSGRISRFSGRRRRDIGKFLSLQPLPGLQMPGAYCSFSFVIPDLIRDPSYFSLDPAFAGMTPRGLTPAGSLGTLGAVL